MIDADIQHSWPLFLWLSILGMTGRGIRIDAADKGQRLPEN